MARAIKKSSGNTVTIPSTAAAHTVGDLVAESHFVGMCNATVAISSNVVLQIDGRFRVKVPASTVLGDILYGVGTPLTNGALLANATVTNLTRTATANTAVCQVMETPTTVNGNLQADVLLLTQQIGK